MISSALLDHTAAVWRFSESKSASLRFRERDWVRVPNHDSIEITVQTRRESWDNPGGGQKPVGEWAAYGPPTMDVREGDVLEIYEGPNAPMKLEVDSARCPRGHHTELVLVSWEGRLTP